MSRTWEAQDQKGLHLTPMNPCMVMRETIPSLANFSTDMAGQWPAHMHLHVSPQLILLLHHLSTAETLMPQLALSIQTLFNQPVKTQVELWENRMKVYSKRRIYFLAKNLYSLKEDTIRRALLSNLAMRYSLTMWSAIVLWQSVPGFEWLVANTARMVEIQVDFCVSFDLGSVWHLLFTHLAHIHTRTPLLCATPLYHRLQNHVEV